MNEGKTERPDDRWKVAGICIFLAAIVWAVFGQTLHHQFVNFDDDKYVTDNYIVQKGLTGDGIRWALTYGQIGHWHPLTWFSHMLDCQLYGLNPAGPHFTNVLIHTAAVILLFLVLRQMTGCLWRCAFVAAVFAIHPLRAESVAWISERKDVLSGFFFMLTLGAYVRYTQRPPSSTRYLAVILCFALGLLSKNMLVTTPFVLLLLDYWPLHRLSSPKELLQRFIEKIPLLVLTALSCVATALVPEKVAAADHLSFLLRMENAVVCYVIYLRQLFWPSHLAALYPQPTELLPLWQVAGSLALLVVITLIAIALRKKHPSFMVGWFWYLGMMIPVIGIIQISFYAHADRYTYLPQIGICLAITWAFLECCRRWRLPNALPAGLGAVAVAVLIFAARRQTAYWHDSFALWTHTLACTSRNMVAHNNYGECLLDRGNVDEAITQLNQALQIDPSYAQAQDNLGNALLQKGEVDEAITHFQIALQSKPDNGRIHFNLANALLKKGQADDAIAHYQKALQFEPYHAEAYDNLGNALFLQGRFDEAITNYEKSLDLKPDNAQANNNLANAFFRKGDQDAAIAHYQQALKLQPDNLEPQVNLGTILLMRGNAGEAAAHFRHALQLQPDYPQIQNTLAWILSTAPDASLRNGHEAVTLATQANQSTGGNNPVMLRTLAAAYAEAGQFTDAAQTVQKAIDLARASGKQAMADQLGHDLEHYNASQPLRAGNK